MSESEDYFKDKKIIYELDMTHIPIKRRMDEDVPDMYRVIERPEVFDGIIVYGKYSAYREEPEWIANPSCRELVRILLIQLSHTIK